MFEVLWLKTWILFLALNNIHILRVFGKSLTNNTPSSIMSNSPPIFASHFSTPPTPLTLVHQPPYPSWHTNCVTHTSSPTQKVKLSQLFKRIAKHLNLSLSLEEAFPFPITTVPLSIATSDEKSGSGKAPFWNYIIKESEAWHTIPLEDAAWFIAASLIRCLKPKKLNKNVFGHWSGPYSQIVL